MKRILFIPCLLLLSHFLYSQENSMALVIRNQPHQVIKLSQVLGDKLIVLDSGFVENEIIRFSLPEHLHTGVYQINLGLSRSARIMNGEPQTLYCILNREDVVLELDFKDPLNSVQVMQSKENLEWYEFLKYLRMIDNQMKLLQQMLERYEQKNELENYSSTATEYNKLQLDRSGYIEDFIQNNPDLFASDLASSFRQPILDGFLTEQERKSELQRQYFRHIDLSNEALLYSDRYTELIFNFLVLYNHPDYTMEQRSERYKGALDLLFQETKPTPLVRETLIDYLKNGFTSLNMLDLVEYLDSK